MTDLVPLSEVAKIRNGYAFPASEFQQSGVPVIRMSDLDNYVVNTADAAKVSERFMSELPSFHINKGDLIIGMSGSVGKIAVYKDKFPALQNQRIGVFRVLDESALAYSYLKFFSFTIEDKLNKLSKGVGVKNVSAEDIEAILLPLPPLPEQQRIAAILEKADGLRRTRRYAQQMSDTFLQSVFLEMFGDPVSNPKGWDVITIDDVVSSSQYGTSHKSNAQRIGYPVLGMANITYSGSLELKSLSYVDISQQEFQALRLVPGDIIFNRTNSTELVGKTAHWNLNMEAVLASYLVKLRLCGSVAPDFFVGLLNSHQYKRLLRERCKAAVGQSNISPTLLKEFPIYLPPYALQEQFACVVERVERLRAQQREATRQAEHLFQSLLRQAFAAKE